MNRRLTESRAALRRFGPALLLAAALAGVGVTGWRYVEAVRTDRAIRALKEGEDVALPRHPAPQLVLARAAYLLRRDRVQEVQSLEAPLERSGDTAARSALLYNLGNRHLREAFKLIADQKLDEAVPLVALAKQSYRQALRLRPDDWDARYNLDIAMRLVRDFPITEQGEGDTLPATRKLWPDLPGQPEGLP